MKENLLQLLSSRSTFVGDSSMWSKCTFCYLDLFIICKFIFAQAISGSATWGHMDVIALFFWEEWISSLSEKVLNLVESFQVDFITSMTSVNVHTYGYYSETFESLSMNTYIADDGMMYRLIYYLLNVFRYESYASWKNHFDQ